MERHAAVLEVLLENARYSVADIARMTDHTEAEVEAAIETLESRGVVRGYRAVVDWHQVDPDRARAEVELNVTLDRETSYDDIARRIAGFSEVKTLQLVSGNYDFLARIEADSTREVSRFVSERIAPIPEITQTVTHFVMDTYKEGGIPMNDSFDEDDRLSVSP